MIGNLSLFNLISEEKKIKDLNNLYYLKLKKIFEKFNKDNIKVIDIKYFNALILAQSQICELNVYIYYIKSLSLIDNQRKKQLKNYSKIIKEKKCLYFEIINQIDNKIRKNEKLKEDFKEITNLANTINEYYIKIASNKDLIIKILYDKFKKSF